MTKYIAGYNMPGYLPEMEPAEFDTFGDAKEFLFQELQTMEDNCNQVGNQDDADVYGEQSKRLPPTWSGAESTPYCSPEMPDGYVYWIDLVVGE